MVEWITLSFPAALILFGIALFFRLFDRFYRATKGVFTFVSSVFAIFGAANIILNGASLWEAATLLTGFLLLNMGVKE